MSVTETVLEELNVAVIRGTCSSPADVRELPSGTVLAQLQVTARVGDEALSVPIAVADPAAWVESLDTGDQIVVIGPVRRRFFRSGGATASRVEVQAELIAPARDRRRVKAVARRIAAVLEAFDA